MCVRLCAVEKLTMTQDDNKPRTRSLTWTSENLPLSRLDNAQDINVTVLFTPRNTLMSTSSAPLLLFWHGGGASP